MKFSLSKLPYGWIAALCWIAYMGYNVYAKSDNKKHTIYDKRGIDTIYEGDTAYVIQFKIKDKFELEPEYEPADPRR